MPEKHPALLNARSRFEELNSAYLEVAPYRCDVRLENSTIVHMSSACVSSQNPDEGPPVFGS